MKAQLYTGWYEAEDGVIFFSELADSLTALYSAMNEYRDPDFGHTDMEVCDESGKDLTETFYNIVKDIEYRKANGGQSDIRKIIREEP